MTAMKLKLKFIIVIKYLLQIPSRTKPAVIVANVDCSQFSQVLCFDEEFILPESSGRLIYMEILSDE